MHRPSRRSGRISLVAIGGICSLLLLLGLFLFSGSSPRTAAAEFMSALSKGDPKGLAALSVIHNESREQIEKDWERTIALSRNYLFFWDIDTVTTQGDHAVVRIQRMKNPGPQAYAEPYQLVLVKTQDGWKVDVTQISREMFPFLPR